MISASSNRVLFSSTAQNQSIQSYTTSISTSCRLLHQKVQRFSTASNNNNSHDYGRLWGRGYETFYDHPDDDNNNEVPTRRIIQIIGSGATTYLQNLVTADVTLTEQSPLLLLSTLSSSG